MKIFLIHFSFKRFAHKYKDDNTEYRILNKAYGIRIIINVSGTAGKFNIIPLMLTTGAGLGLMSISVIVADCVMLHCTKERKYYQKMKECPANDELDTELPEPEPEPELIARI